MNMPKVTKVLLLLKNMIYESTAPMEVIRFAKYYKNVKNLDVTIVLWGPAGILLGKKNKVGVIKYEEDVQECLSMGIKILACDLAAKIIGLDPSELMTGIEIVASFKVADLLLQYQELQQLIISL
jgi:predicted peroxiredoxin